MGPHLAALGLGLLLLLSRRDSSVTPWTVARQAPQSMGFARQEYWSGLLFPSPGDLPNPGIEPSTLQADALPSEPPQAIRHSQKKKTKKNFFFLLEVNKVSLFPKF